MMARLLIYPTGDLTGDPGLALEEAHLRADLHEIVEKLDRTDLRAVHELVEALVLVPRDPGLFDYIERMDARRLALSGLAIPENSEASA